MVQNGELQFLVAERVWLEISRGLLENKPSRMIQVLMDSFAAKYVLPNDFQNVDILQKTQSAIDIGVKQHDLQVQIAFLLAFIELPQLEAWALQWKIPTEMRNFAKIFHQFLRVLEIQNRTAEQVFNFFNQSDASRKAERLEKIIHTAELLGLQVDFWKKMLNAYNSVDAGLIAKNLQSSDGTLIQSTIAKARLQAIAACY
jgi:tRNA nucleotidyltransferase (CCA-adding enzyme)